MAQACQFEIYKDTAGNYRWRLRAKNGQIIATPGENYTSKQGCENGIRAVIECCRGDVAIEDQT